MKQPTSNREERKAVLERITQQLSCICKQYDIEFLFVSGIPDDEYFLGNIHMDGDSNLANFLGEAYANLERQHPDFLAIGKKGYEEFKDSFQIESYKYNEKIQLLGREVEVNKYDEEDNEVNVSYRLAFDFYGEEAICVVSRSGLDGKSYSCLCMAEGGGSLHESFGQMIEEDEEFIAFLRKHCDEMDEETKAFNKEIEKAAGL